MEPVEDPPGEAASADPGAPLGGLSLEEALQRGRGQPAPAVAGSSALDSAAPTAPGAPEASIETIEALARRYGGRRCLLGIELLNEPSWALEWQHAQLHDYYTRALRAVRKYSAHALVVFNVLYWFGINVHIGCFFLPLGRILHIILNFYSFEFPIVLGRTMALGLDLLFDPFVIIES